KGLAVETGRTTFRLGRDAFPFAQVAVGGADLLAPGSARAVFTDARGGEGRPLGRRCEGQAPGPGRTPGRCGGDLGGRARLRFRARLCFFAGTGLVRLRFTLHNPDRARHKGGLWDLGDPGSVLFRDLSLELGLADAAGLRTVWLAEPSGEA